MNLQELEIAVTALPPKQLADFKRWFDHYFAEEWDRQIEADIASGRLDTAGQKADSDFNSGNCTPR